MTVRRKTKRRARPARKTARNTAVGRPFARGKDPRRGHGKKGRSGRPPKAFKVWARGLYDDPRIRAAVERTLRNPKSKHFATVLRALLPYVAQSEDGEAMARAVRRGLKIEIVPKREEPAT